jgi:hypothetical protein
MRSGMKRHLSVALVLLGMILGCGATALSPIASSFAQQPAGRWDCFVVDRFPDVEEARSWSGAANIAAGLNTAAKHVAAGTVLAVTPKSSSGSYPSVACVKY